MLLVEIFMFRWMFLSCDCMFLCCVYIIFVCAAYWRNNKIIIESRTPRLASGIRHIFGRIRPVAAVW